jgi:putative aldouronate transport system substrate-binding protein
VQDRRYIEQYSALPEQKAAIETWMKADNSRLMPVISPTAEESTRYASIMNDVNTYYEEMVNKFIMGVEPISGFDKFVETIQGMGIEEAVKIQQAALDRFNSR